MLTRSLFALLVLAARLASAQSAPFNVSSEPWDSETLGNHRAVVQVRSPGRFARVRLEWRRPDRNPESKAVIVLDARTQRPIRNIVRETMTQHVGTLTFEPTSGPGRYDVYYMPYKSGGRSNYPNVTYLSVADSSEASWRESLRSAKRIPAATVTRFEAIDSLDLFAPMAVIASPEETSRLRTRYASRPFLIFPEDRLHSIRLRDQLPLRWVRRGPTETFSDVARRGEFLAFQLGVLAQRPLRDVRVTFSDLRSPSGVIPSNRVTSINNGGTNWDGKPLAIQVAVPQGRVQAMWCGVDVPEDAVPGTYTGTATVSATGVPAQAIRLVVRVRPEVVRAQGADEPEKLTRLAWLNSTRGQRNDVIAPYTPIEIEGRTLKFLGRSITLDATGFPSAIESWFSPEMTGYARTPQPVLAAPMRFGVSGAGDTRPTESVRFERREPGTVTWEASADHGAWTLEVRGTLEFDGNLSYETVLRAREDLALDDVALTIPYTREASVYAMGLGLKGQKRPRAMSWKWEVATRNQDGAWLGGVNAGLQFSLRAENYVRPLNTNFYLQKPLLLPSSWGNDGKGSITWREEGSAVVVRAASGARRMARGDSLRFDAHFLVTPFHTLDTDAQWSRRFYHRYAPLDSIAATGATVVNIHHANEINPWINYPFIAHGEMKAFVDDAHRRGLHVKIYNTVRELSNHAWELHALRSLGHEVFSPGQGGGYSWLQEHLQDDYIAAWFVPTLKDAAVVNSGMSRWHNYYVEGINWLVQNVAIDGLYLDDVAFDRTTMKRVRRMLRQAGRPGIIDLHSANQFNERDGFINSAMLYMEHFPFIDRLWFGEYFDYQKSPADFWMTEVSGIPFGLMGEMLEGGGNPWRGMLYGMTNRMPWSDGADPRPIWALWDMFGMSGSEMFGYWSPNVQVTTGRDDVLATVYRHKGRALVAVASWAPEPVDVILRVKWQALGLDESRATIELPAVPGLQSPSTLRPGTALTVHPGKGALLLLR